MNHPNLSVHVVAFFLALLLGVAEAPGLAAADLVITEFMADNRSAYVDEDGDYPDWIEIYNRDEAPVRMAGWSLTDKRGDLKWQFPDMEIAPRRFLIVFASGKNRNDPAKPLHATFNLADVGEYLAIVGPDGLTVVSEHADYPAQAENASYGYSMQSQGTLFAGASAAARVFIPTGGDLALTWTAPEFDDSAWTAGTAAIGFDTKTTPTYTDLITNDIGLMMKNVNTSAYIRIRFDVADLSRVSSLVLRLKYEDGFIAWLNGQEVARKNAPTTISWASRASPRRAEKDALVFETFDLSRHIGRLVAAGNVLAIQGLNEAKTGLAFLMVPEVWAYEVTGIDTGQREFFSPATPGRGNETGFPGIAEAPSFSLPSGAYLDAVNLLLSVASPTATIRYTIDRKEPTEESTAYTAPIAISKTTIVRARTFEPGLLPSRTITQTFIALDATLKDFSSNLPVLVINTFGPTAISIPEDPLTSVWLSAFYPGDESRSSFKWSPDFESQIGIKIRGSSSLSFPKKSYRIETWDGNGNERESVILGFPRESDYILYAPYTDKTLMRDVLSYDWSNAIGRWAPRVRFVELYLSTSAAKLRSADYLGVYVFIEKIKWGKERVDIERIYPSQNEEPEVTGGYILKKDRLDPGESGFFTSQSQQLCYVHPPERETAPAERAPITTAQKAWIKKYLDTFEGVLYGNNFTDPVNGYAKFIDVDSFIDHHLMVEITKNIDGYRLSTFMYKDRGGLLNMGPIWDYNLTLGNADYLQGWIPQGWYYTQCSAADYPWYPRLSQDPAYIARYKERWFNFRQGPFSTAKLMADIDRYVDLLQESQVRNYKKWPILGIYVWPNPQPIPTSYAGEITFMKQWLDAHVAWMDSTLLSVPTFTPKAGNVTTGTMVTISSPTGTIYYTMDGTDPKLADGNPAPSAKEFSEPIAIDTNVKIRARVKAGSSWSNLAEATYIVYLAPLVVTEVNYAPMASPDGTIAGDDFEFVEIQNVGDAEVDLTGYQTSDSARLNFTGSKVTKVAPGGFVVIVKKLAAFSTRYDAASIPIAGEYTGTLSNKRGTIGIKGPLSEVILRFTYDSTWYPETNAAGRSLTIIDPKGPRESWVQMESWRPSAELNGSPGRADGTSPIGKSLPGDIDGDGKLSLTDPMNILAILYQGESTLLRCGTTIDDEANRKLLDTNGDSRVDLTDAVGLLEHLFLAGPPPALGTDCVDIPGCQDTCGS
jgi:hypothetical protein